MSIPLFVISAQIQVVSVDCFDLPAEDNFEISKAYRYGFVVRENPQDITDWGYKDHWRSINPKPEDILIAGQTYTANIVMCLDGSTQGGMLRAVNQYYDFKSY